MRSILVALLAAMLFFLAGCASDRPVDHGPIAVPPASAGVSAAKEDVIAQMGAALAKEYQARSAAHDAATAAERSAAKTEVLTAKAEGVALKAVLKHQDESEQQASVRWCIVTGLGLIALGVFLGYETRVKLGIGLALSGGSLALGAMVLTALIPYELLLAKAGIVAAFLALIWHYRTSVKAHAEVIEHLVAGHAVTEWHYLSDHGAAILMGIYFKAKADAAKAWATLRHFGHAPAAPTPTPAAPAVADAPKPPVPSPGA